MQTADRQAALKKRGSNAATVALKLGVSKTGVGKILKGIARSARIEAALAEAIGLPPEKIWPEWYGGEATTVEAHAAIDSQLVGEIRRVMHHFGIARGGCALPYAIPRLRHVIMVYNQVRKRFTGNESIGESAKLITAEVERYALALIDPDDPQMFGRNWWEPLESFANPGADLGASSAPNNPTNARDVNITGGVKVKRGTVLGNYIKG